METTWYLIVLALVCIGKKETCCRGKWQEEGGAGQVAPPPTTALPRPTRKRSHLLGEQNTAGAIACLALVCLAHAIDDPHPTEWGKWPSSAPPNNRNSIVYSCNKVLSGILFRNLIRLKRPIVKTSVFTTKMELLSEEREEFVMYFINLCCPNSFDA